MAPRTSPGYWVETNILRKVANNPKCRWRFTQHALDRMAERGIVAADVERVAKNGQVVFHEIKQDLLWRVEGTDVDGDRMQVHLVVYETEIRIKIITTF